MKADEVAAVLEESVYKAPEWAFLQGVRSATGWQRTVRYADAVAMSLYPSRGLAVHAIEIKVSRSDLRREIADPDKAEVIAAYCDEFHVAVPADLAEYATKVVPARWGLYAVDADGARSVKKATLAEKPAPLDRVFVASVLRAAWTMQPGRREIRRRIEAAVEQERKRSEELAKTQRGWAEGELESLRAVVDEFQKASGIQLTSHISPERAKRMGAVCRLFSYADRIHLDQARNLAAAAVKDLDEALVELDKAREG